MLLDALSLHQLRALDLLLELQSVSRAAERMGVTQSAMSHALRGLREALDDPLFVRAGGGLQPTPRAEALRVPLRRALHDLNAALSQSRFDPALTQRRFSMGMPDGTALLVVPPLLAALRRVAPHADLDVRGGVSQRIEALETGELDLQFEVRPPDVASLMARVLYRDDFVCMVCAASPLRDGLSLDAYCASPHALVSPTGTGRGVVDGALDAVGRSRRVAARVRYFLAAPSLVAGTDLVLTLPRRVAKALYVDGRVAMVEPPIALPGFSVSMVWHRRMDADPGHRWLREQVVATQR